ncbi:MAG: terminase small subunit, partial [Armatimonadetes bacterium]|nr:terminase small subunit [Armatimonadota bacterium]
MVQGQIAKLHGERSERIEESAKRNLTAKQQRFCEEYLDDLNATQAAIRAGYSERSARAIGCENLTKDECKKEISRMVKARANRLSIS